MPEMKMAGRGGRDGRAVGGLPILSSSDAQCGLVTVSSSSIELKGAASRLDGRRRLLFQPTDGDIWVALIADATAVKQSNTLKVTSGTIMEVFFGDGEDDVAVNAIYDSADVKVMCLEMKG